MTTNNALKVKVSDLWCLTYHVGVTAWWIPTCTSCMLHFSAALLVVFKYVSSAIQLTSISCLQQSAASTALAGGCGRDNKQERTVTNRQPCNTERIINVGQLCLQSIWLLFQSPQCNHAASDTNPSRHHADPVSWSAAVNSNRRGSARFWIPKVWQKP